MSKLPAGALIGSLMGSLSELLNTNYTKAAEMIRPVATSTDSQKRQKK